MFYYSAGKISALMGDVVKGIKSFKKGMSDPDSISENPESSNKDSEDKNNPNSH